MYFLQLKLSIKIGFLFVMQNVFKQVFKIIESGLTHLDAVSIYHFGRENRNSVPPSDLLRTEISPL